MNCVICTRLISHNSDVRATVCGHVFHYICLIQWLWSSKTCPQCRTECTEDNITRLNFNFENLDREECALQQEWESVKLELLDNKEKLKKADERKDEIVRYYREINIKQQGKLDKMKNEFIKKADHLKEQIERLTADAKLTEEFRKEIESLKQQFQIMEDGTCKFTPNDAEVKTKENPKTLSFCVKSIKQELEKCKNENCQLQNDLQREIESKKKLEERMCYLENLTKIRFPSTF